MFISSLSFWIWAQVRCCKNLLDLLDLLDTGHRPSSNHGDLVDLIIIINTGHIEQALES